MSLSKAIDMLQTYYNYCKAFTACNKVRSHFRFAASCGWPKMTEQTSLSKAISMLYVLAVDLSTCSP